MFLLLISVSKPFLFHSQSYLVYSFPCGSDSTSSQTVLTESGTSEECSLLSSAVNEEEEEEEEEQRSGLVKEDVELDVIFRSRS